MLLAASSHTRGLQDELDEICPLLFWWYPIVGGKRRIRVSGSAKAQWLNPSRTSGKSGGETSHTYEEHKDTWKAGAAEWLVHKFESKKDCGFKNNGTQNRAMVDQPAKVTQTF